jgi:hypothetical protein
VNVAPRGTRTAERAAVLTLQDEYNKKVREIALLQCRCETGADLETDRPKMTEEEQPQAA